MSGISAIIGHVIVLEDECPVCTSCNASISHGVGSHAAALKCECGRFRRWLSAKAVTALVNNEVAVTKVFGRPTIELKKLTEHTAMLLSADAAVVSSSSSAQRK
jgi:hypothetical protein